MSSHELKSRRSRRVPQTVLTGVPRRSSPPVSRASAPPALLPCPAIAAAAAAATTALDAVGGSAGKRCHRPSPVRSPSWDTGASVSPALRWPGCSAGSVLASPGGGGAGGRARPSRSIPALTGAEERAEKPAGPLPGHRPASGADGRAILEEPIGKRGLCAAPTRPEGLHFPPGQSQCKGPSWAGGEPGTSRDAPSAPPGSAARGLRRPTGLRSGAPRSPSEQRSWDGDGDGGSQIGGDASSRPVEVAKGCSALRDFRRFTKSSCFLRPP